MGKRRKHSSRKQDGTSGVSMDPNSSIGIVSDFMVEGVVEDVELAPPRPPSPSRTSPALSVARKHKKRPQRQHVRKSRLIDRLESSPYGSMDDCRPSSARVDTIRQLSVTRYLTECNGLEYTDFSDASDDVDLEYAE